MRYLTAQKRASGLGTAHSGTRHFIEQRLSAVALIVLLPLFLIFVAPSLFDAPETVQTAFASSYWMGLVSSATLIVTALHLAQGLQVVIEDYTQGGMRVALLALMRIGILALTLAALWAVVLLSLS